jgi:hypothetical protein
VAVFTEIAGFLTDPGVNLKIVVGIGSVLSHVVEGVRHRTARIGRMFDFVQAVGPGRHPRSKLLNDAVRICALARRRDNNVAVLSPQSQWVLGIRGLTMDLFQVLKRIDCRWAADDGRGTSHVFATERAAREFASRRRIRADWRIPRDPVLAMD